MEEDKKRQEAVIEQLAKHIAVLNDEVGTIQADMIVIKVSVAGIKTDLSWLRRLAWWQMGLIASLLLGSIGYILFA